MDAALQLLNEENFKFVLPGVFADEVLEKVFGNTRMRNAGNFYIDVIDFIASAKVVNLHALLKYDLLPSDNDAKGCFYCKEPLYEDDVEALSDH